MKNQEISDMSQRIAKLTNEGLLHAYGVEFRDYPKNMTPMEQTYYQLVQAEILKRMRRPTNDEIYAAWHGAGVDIAGGNWSKFVSMLP